MGRRGHHLYRTNSTTEAGVSVVPAIETRHTSPSAPPRVVIIIVYYCYYYQLSPSARAIVRMWLVVVVGFPTTTWLREAWVWEGRAIGRTDAPLSTESATTSWRHRQSSHTPDDDFPAPPLFPRLSRRSRLLLIYKHLCSNHPRP